MDQAEKRIELEKRLEIVRYVFNTSNITTVHMKDWATGPEGFVPFINNVLTGLYMRVK